MSDFGQIRREATTAGLDLFEAAAEAAADTQAAAAAQAACKAVAAAVQTPCATLPMGDVGERLAALLRGRIGRERAISSAEAARALGLAGRGADAGRQVRELLQVHYVDLGVQLLESDGAVLVAGSEGYWLSQDPDELRRYLSTLLSRATCCLDRAEAAAELAARWGLAGAPRAHRSIGRGRRHLGAVQADISSGA